VGDIGWAKAAVANAYRLANVPNFSHTLAFKDIAHLLDRRMRVTTCTVILLNDSQDDFEVRSTDRLRADEPSIRRS